MAASDSTPSPIKGQQFEMPFVFIDNTTGKGITGATGIVTKIMKDDGSATTTTNTTTETALGFYRIVFTATEMNADRIDFVATSTSTNAQDAFASIPTQSAGKILVTLDDASLITSKLGAFALAKGANITGFNDIPQGTAMTLTTDYLKSLSKGTAGAGASSTVTLQTALGADNNCVGCLVFIYGGTGINQVRTIIGYVNSTKVVTVDRAWTVTPDNTSTYLILATDNPALSTTLAVVAGTVSDKTGYALTAAYDLSKTASQAGDAMSLTSGERTTLTAVIWAALTSGITTAGSIGKRILDFVTTLVYAAAPTASANAIATRDVNNTSPAANSLGAAVNNASAPTVVEIDTQLSNTHGSGQWGSSSGSGAFLVTVTVTDNTAALVPNANVRVSNNTEGTFVAQTNSSGVASFSLNAAVFDITITKPQTQFTPSTITVTTSANFPEVIQLVAIPAPPAGGLISNVFGSFEGLSSTTSTGIIITFTLSVPKAKSGPIIITDPIVARIVNGALLGPSGQAYVPLYRNDGITPAATTYSVNCPAIGFNNVTMTLAAPTFDLASLIS